MEKRNKCDVIPVWMFRELDDGARHLLQGAKNELSKVREEVLSKLNEEIEEMSWDEIRGEPIEESFKYEGGRYNCFNLKPKIQSAINKKRDALKKKVVDKYAKEIGLLDKKYEQWKMQILVGKILRSRVKGFEL